MVTPTIKIGDFHVFKGAVTPDDQRMLVSELRVITQKAPLFSPKTPSGKRMSVKMTSAGKYGWFSDHHGYRYVDTHPKGMSWPKIPTLVQSLWDQFSQIDRKPDCCLINYYTEQAKMGLHQDKDEADFSYPVLSISLGDSAQFRLGGSTRSDATQSFWLDSGDICVMGGASRLNFHGVDRIKFGSSALLKNAGRINLTLRVVDP